MQSRPLLQLPANLFGIICGMEEREKFLFKPVRLLVILCWLARVCEPKLYWEKSSVEMLVVLSCTPLAETQAFSSCAVATVTTKTLGASEVQ